MEDLKRKDKIDAKTQLLISMLEILKEKKIINDKQMTTLLKATGTSEKDSTSSRKIKKILDEITKNSKEQHVHLPSYLELRKNSKSSLYQTIRDNKKVDDLLFNFSQGLGITSQDVGHVISVLIDNIRFEQRMLKEDEEKKKQKQERHSQISKDQDIKEVDNQATVEYKTPSRKIFNTPSEEIETPEDIERKIAKEIKAANDPKTIEETLKEEERKFDEALNGKGYVGKLDLGKSYDRNERNRKDYIKDVFNVAFILKRLAGQDKTLNNSVIYDMNRIASEIEEIIYNYLLSVNDMDTVKYGKASSSKLKSLTMLNPKYDPDKLLSQYTKLYEKYSEQMNNPKIKALLDSKTPPLTSPKAIIANVNLALKEKMVEKQVGLIDEDYSKLAGSLALIKYMSEEEIASVEKRVRKEYESTAYLDVNENNREETLKKISENLQNLQFNYCKSINSQFYGDRKLTEICREVLHEEPLFNEPRKVKSSNETEITAIAKRQRTGKFRRFIERMKSIFSRDTANEQDNTKE